MLPRFFNLQPFSSPAEAAKYAEETQREYDVMRLGLLLTKIAGCMRIRVLRFFAYSNKHKSYEITRIGNQATDSRFGVHC